jgi:glucose-1-phosphate thymidylyltransferase
MTSEKADAVAWVKQVEDPRRFGVAEVDTTDKVLRLVEKPDDLSNNLAVVGFYYFKEAERLVRAIETQMESGTQLGGEYYLVDAINILLDQGLHMRVEPVDVWKDCGKPEALLETNRYLLENNRDNSDEAARRPDTLIIPPVYVHPSAEVTQSVIGPHASIGPECVVYRSVVQNSILEADSQVHEAVVEGSIIGMGAKLVGRAQSYNVGDQSQINVA